MRTRKHRCLACRGRLVTVSGRLMCWNPYCPGEAEGGGLISQNEHAWSPRLLAVREPARRSDTK